MKQTSRLQLKKKKALNPTCTKKALLRPPTPPEHLGATTKAHYQFWPQGTCEKAHNAPGPLCSICIFLISPFSSRQETHRQILTLKWLNRLEILKTGEVGSDTMFNSQTAELSISIRVTQSSPSSGRILGSVQKIAETNISEGSSLFPFFSPLTRVFFATSSSVADEPHSTSYSTIRASVAALILV